MPAKYSSSQRAIKCLGKQLFVPSNDFMPYGHVTTANEITDNLATLPTVFN